MRNFPPGASWGNMGGGEQAERGMAERKKIRGFVLHAAGFDLISGTIYSPLTPPGVTDPWT